MIVFANTKLCLSRSIRARKEQEKKTRLERMKRAEEERIRAEEEAIRRDQEERIRSEREQRLREREERLAKLEEERKRKEEEEMKIKAQEEMMRKAEQEERLKKIQVEGKQADTIRQPLRMRRSAEKRKDSQTKQVTGQEVLKEKIKQEPDDVNSWMDQEEAGFDDNQSQNQEHGHQYEHEHEHEQEKEQANPQDEKQDEDDVQQSDVENIQSWLIAERELIKQKRAQQTAPQPNKRPRLDEILPIPTSISPQPNLPLPQTLPTPFQHNNRIDNFHSHAPSSSLKKLAPLPNSFYQYSQYIPQQPPQRSTPHITRSQQESHQFYTQQNFQSTQQFSQQPIHFNQQIIDYERIENQRLKACNLVFSLLPSSVCSQYFHDKEIGKNIEVWENLSVDALLRDVHEQKRADQKQSDQLLGEVHQLNNELYNLRTKLKQFLQLISKDPKISTADNPTIDKLFGIYVDKQIQLRQNQNK